MQSLWLVIQEDNVVASQCALCKGHSVGLHPTLLTVPQLANPCIVQAKPEPPPTLV